jgi:hypothetical protein
MPICPSVAVPATAHTPMPLACYWDGSSMREVVLLDAWGASGLVVDRRLSGDDARLVAHLWPDEPIANAVVVALRYLASSARGRCRRVRPADLHTVPSPGPLGDDLPAEAAGVAELVDRRGRCYSLRPMPSEARGITEVRWTRRWQGTREWEVVSLRGVVGAMEAYEPAQAITAAALRDVGRGSSSVATLRAELRRVSESPIVLNRRLREVVLERMARHGLSMSEVAIRCGRVKCDVHGRVSGETSWLGRRLGIISEGGPRPSPWVHTEVLALIARDGLGLAPREVEP